MAKAKGLGRGLDALLGGGDFSTVTTTNGPHPDDVRHFPKSTVTTSASAQNIAIADIEANPNQPRRAFEEKGLKELAESIDVHGIIQPITLRKIRASKYQIISGERRFRAAQRVGLTSLPAYVREANDRTLLEMALVENIQREDLNPLEVGLSFQHLMDECGLTQEVLAQRVGKARSTVTHFLRLLDLPDAVQRMLREKVLSMGHAKVLSGVKGNDAPYTQVALAEKASAEQLSVRALEQLVKDGGWRPQAKKHAPAAPLPLREDEEQALHMLRLRLKSTQASPSIQRLPKGGGQVTLKYGDLNDLEAVLRKLGLH